MFAKSFETSRGQVLVMKNSNNVGDPELQFYFEPEGLGVCSINLGFGEDSDRAWDALQDAFNQSDIVLAEKIAKDISNQTKAFTDENEI
jgi:hypothetical protein